MSSRPERVFAIQIELKNDSYVYEVVQALMHTIFFFRTLEGSFEPQEASCPSLSVHYSRVPSKKIRNDVDQQASQFADLFRQKDAGTLCVSFLVTTGRLFRQSRVWEKWDIHVRVTNDPVPPDYKDALSQEMIRQISGIMQQMTAETHHIPDTPSLSHRADESMPERPYHYVIQVQEESQITFFTVGRNFIKHMF